MAEHTIDNNLACSVYCYWWTCCHLACREYYIKWLSSCLTIAWHDWHAITVLSPCWRSILLTTTRHVWYCFHVCVSHRTNIHTIVSSLQHLLGIPSLQQLAFSLYQGGFVSGRLQEQELLRQQQRQCQSLMRMRNGISQQQEHVNVVNANQRSDEVRYGRPIWRGMQMGAHVCQRSDEVKYGRPIWRGMQMGAHVCQRSDEVRYGRPIGQGMQRDAHVCQRSDMQRGPRIMIWTWLTRKRIHVTTVTVGISVLIRDTSWRLQ